MPSQPRPSASAPAPRPARRAVLGSLAALGLVPVLGACEVRWVVGDEPTPTPDRGPDDVAREAAVADTLALLAVLDAAAAGPAPLQAVAADAARVCRAHLVALGAGSAAGTGTSTGTSTGAVTAGQAQEVADRLTQASSAAVAELAPATGRAPGGGTTRLLTALAASRAVLADTVAVATGAVVRPADATSADVDAGPTPTTTPTTAPPTTPTTAPTDAVSSARVRALQAALAGEHAAVYAYGLVVARLTSPRREEALGDLAAHRVVRDDLVDELTALRATPVEAAAGYDVAAPTAQAALALAAAVEDRTTTLRVDVVATAGTGRADAARGAVSAARSARRWGSTVVAFPGAPWLGEDGRALATASPTGSASGSPTP